MKGGHNLDCEIISDFKEAIDFVELRRVLGMGFQMHRIEYLLNVLGNPQQRCKYIHISGTNGKGSTVTYLMNLFRETGLNVGTFTSPYLDTFLEHFHYNNGQMSEDTFIRLMNIVAPVIKYMDKTETYAGVTEFELATAIMFLYFSELKPDIVLVEVGMGGRLDATNVLIPEISVITTIGIDHTGILGCTLEAIAYQKAGIIKRERPVVVGFLRNNPLSIIESVAEENHSKLIKPDNDYMYFNVQINEGKFSFSFSGLGYVFYDLQINMSGMHQIRNACTALSVYLLYCSQNLITVSEKVIRMGISKAYWPGRFEIVNTSPMIILDGAHNVDGMNALLEVIGHQYKNRHIFYLYSALSNKDTDTMIAMIDKLPNIELIFTEFERLGVEKAIDLSRKTKKSYTIRYDYWNVICDFIDHNTDDSILLIGGSLYFISAIRRKLLEIIKNGRIKGR